MPESTCVVEWCDQPRASRWRCADHYSRGRLTCMLPGCGKRHYGKGLCRPHWAKEHRAPRPSTNSGALTNCERCGAQFRQPRAGVIYCSQRCNSAAYVSRHGARALYLRKQFRMTVEEWETIFDEQGRACAICRSPEAGGQGWAVDHDHACCPTKGRSCGRCVRGILCFNCNTALGKWGDSPGTLGRALAYVTEGAYRKLVIG